tara:strand:+ start:73 stop:579 length:507 start_codon:yes stop_codon:yes gene_type:complete
MLLGFINKENRMSGLARTLKGISGSFKESQNMTTAEGRKFFEEREKQGKVDSQKQFEAQQERERQERIHARRDIRGNIRKNYIISTDNLANKKREKQEQYKTQQKRERLEQYKAQQERERQERLQVLKKKFKGYYKNKFQTEEKDKKEKKKTPEKKETKAKKETKKKR